MQSFIVEKSDAGQRLDKYLKKTFPNAPGGLIYKMLRKKNITLNNHKADGTELICGGDEIKTFFSDETYEKFRGSKQEENKISNPSFVNLKVIYEDDNLIFFNKPYGVLSQSDEKGNFSVNTNLIEYLKEKKEYSPSNNYRPSAANRLDRNTSGIIMCAKTYIGARFLDDCIKNHRMKKQYLAIATGVIENAGKLSGYLIKDEKNNKVSVSNVSKSGGVLIETEYEPVKNDGSYTLLKVNLITGKSHQIRAHLASINHPLAGDIKYGGKEFKGKKMQFLHSYKMTFPEIIPEDFKEDFSHMQGKTVECEPPDYFKLT